MSRRPSPRVDDQADCSLRAGHAPYRVFVHVFSGMSADEPPRWEYRPVCGSVVADTASRWQKRYFARG